ncbi:MAG: hypothetical protein UW70_C0029G0002 [Candidatus Peregrinibacteria bacterium GW2011_GWA2_44_7]|nr:MAG: hypothetical protein UW70_C0029G0002 [Candidatus Peregrinibacteria bacterium GW2011_GWA2_44_7]
MVVDMLRKSRKTLFRWKTAFFPSCFAESPRRLVFTSQKNDLFPNRNGVLRDFLYMVPSLCEFTIYRVSLSLNGELMVR